MNNARRRPHATWYGAGAFYDLYRTGRQERMATDLRPGQECVVATPVGNGDIEFNWYAFSNERVMDDPERPGGSLRVFFGERGRSDVLSRAKAAATDPYSGFFDRNGNFKRSAVIRRQKRGLKGTPSFS